MKVIFFGTPPFAGEILRYLLEKKIEIIAVVTQPDKPRGRNLRLTPSAVKEVALSLDPRISVYQPIKASEPLFLQELESLQGDLYVVAAYGQILSQKLLSIPPLGCINVHASLLPKYRGAAPIQRALMNGDLETGVSIQKMVYKLDAGDVIQEKRIPLSIEETHGELEKKLCELSKPLLLDILRAYEQGIPEGVPQDDSQATLAPKIKPEETEIHWNSQARTIHNQVRGLSPRPGAWCWIETAAGRKKLKILQTKISDRAGLPGHVLAFEKGECIVGAQNGSLELSIVQPEGKKAMSARDWMSGCHEAPCFMLSKNS